MGKQHRSAPSFLPRVDHLENPPKVSSLKRSAALADAAFALGSGPPVVDLSPPAADRAEGPGMEARDVVHQPSALPSPGVAARGTVVASSRDEAEATPRVRVGDRVTSLPRIPRRPARFAP